MKAAATAVAPSTAAAEPSEGRLRAARARGPWRQLGQRQALDVLFLGEPATLLYENRVCMYPAQGDWPPRIRRSPESGNNEPARRGTAEGGFPCPRACRYLLPSVMDAGGRMFGDREGALEGLRQALGRAQAPVVQEDDPRGFAGHVVVDGHHVDARPGALAP